MSSKSGTGQSLKHFIDWEIKEFEVNESFKVSQITSQSFDPFLRDVFVPLCAGATLYIPESQEIILNPKKLKEWIEKKEITFIHMVPTLFKSLLENIEDSNAFDNLKYILLAGEMLRGNDVKKFFQLFKDRIQLVNLYGPTETTLAKLFYRIREADIQKYSIPVGKPIDNTQVMVLNKDMQICEVGSIGEIYIRTPFISSGYYKNKELTQKSFIKNPFSSNIQDIIYKTGDVGRLLADDNLEVMGRVDRQVKLRGFRIELGEIENQLLRIETIKQAIVVAWQGTNDSKYLCAYFTSDNDVELDKLRGDLLGELPEYMVPSYFIYLDKMPMTPNGKIDRNALPKPDEKVDTKREYISPTNKIEENLVKIWEEVFGVKGIGITDNFFELGGHSLNAAAIVGKIHRELNAEVPLRKILNNTTIKDVSNHIQKSNNSIYKNILPIEEKEYYPTSSAQRRIYLLSQLEGGDISYNIPKILTIEGYLDSNRLEKTILALINRHEILRTSFEMINNGIVQKVHKNVDFSVASTEVDDNGLDKIIENFVKPFDLSKAPLLRVKIIKLSEKRHVVMFDIHHIISDAASIAIIIKEFLKLYKGDKLPDLRIQYKDFTAWQNEFFEGEEIKNQEEYWLNTFSGEIPVLSIPTDYPRPALQSFEGSLINFEIDRELTKGLNNLAVETGATLYMTLLAAYKVLLFKYTGQQDIVVGSSIAGRENVDLQNIVGMFVNTIAMRNYPKDELTFKEFLEMVKENAIEAYENQDYQFEHLVEKLHLQRDMSRNPLFDTMFEMQNVSEKFDLEGMKIKPYEFNNTVAKFDLALSFQELNGQIDFTLEYCTKLFKRETMERMIEHFKRILEVIVSNYTICLEKIEILSNEEKQKILIDFNDNNMEFSKHKMLYELIDHYANVDPNRIAVVFKDRKLTYRELNEKSNQLAKVLIERGVKNDELIAVIGNRTIEMLIGILGVFKAGGAYVPVDSNLPVNRIKDLIAESQTNIVIITSYISLDPNVFFNQSSFNERINYVIDLNDEKEFSNSKSDKCETLTLKYIEKNPKDNLPVMSKSSNLCYVIFTSGSTGKPKGAMIEHVGMMNHIYAKLKDFDITENSIIAQNASHCFDISVWQFFAALTVGGQTVIYSNETSRDPEKLMKKVIEDKVTILEVVPSFLSVMLDYMEANSLKLEHLNALVVTGETLSPNLVTRWFKLYPKIKVINAYGPTEASDDITHYIMQEPPEYNTIPIGKPLNNFNIYIVDKNMNLCPIGIKGEICVSGIGVGRGYLNNPKKTKEVFMKDPFFENGQKRLYRTGDIGRWIPDGNIEFFGRKDNQVKVRGFRIELGEIESQLLKHRTIKECVVLVKGELKTGKYLCAYVVGREKLSTVELREYLSKELPAYMIPSYFIFLDKLPLTPNGKINRKVLPEPEGPADIGVEYVAPTNKVEEKIISIWEEILGLKGMRIGIEHDFFEIGGNSIKILKVVNLINKEFGINLSLSELFLNTTVSSIARNIYNENIFNELNCVVRMNKQSNGKKNIFILHGREGTIYEYKELAKQLEGECDFYGIQAKGLTKECILPSTVDEMVREYIKEIKAIQPEGPYIIGGYCYGLILAYDMASILEEQGDVIERFLVLDEQVYIDDFSIKNMKIKKHVLNAVKKIYKNNPKDTKKIQADKRYNSNVDNGLAKIQDAKTVGENMRYVTLNKNKLRPTIDAPIYLIKAMETMDKKLNIKHWSKMTDGKVSLYEIPGNHDSILTYPHVKSLAYTIKKIIV